MSTDLKRIVEAVLFAAETPLSLAQICQVLETKDKGPVETAIQELCREYDYLERAFDLVEVAGGWRLRTRPEMAFWLRKLKKQSATRLSRASLETLAIIAYKQPVLKAEIERIRGVEVSGVLRMLMEKDLVRVVGRKDLPGRPLIYGTTRRFLEVFDLKDLRDLPTLEEMQDLLGEPDMVVEGEQDEAPLFTRGMAGQDDDESGEEYAAELEAEEMGDPDAIPEEPYAVQSGPQEQYTDQAEELQPEETEAGVLDQADAAAEMGGDSHEGEAPYKKIEPAAEPREDTAPGGETVDASQTPEAEPEPAQPRQPEAAGDASDEPREPHDESGPEGGAGPRQT